MPPIAELEPDSAVSGWMPLHIATDRCKGYPILMTEMLALLPGVAYAARGSVADPGHIGRTKAMIRAACQAQVDGAGFSIVEVLSNCPVGWGMTAPESMAHLSEVSDVYPLGVLVDRTGGAT
jgi:2-oxoglutarate ferredoxin oxidoreductase subunit beta